MFISNLNVVGRDVSGGPSLVAGLDEGRHADVVGAPHFGDGGLDPSLVGVEVQPLEVGVHGAGGHAAHVAVTAGRGRRHCPTDRRVIDRRVLHSIYYHPGLPPW